mgnify:CR=1 FL=1
MRGFLRRWLLVCLSVGWAQRASFLYALWDLDFETAEREALLEWNASYQTWDQHRIAFFRAVFPISRAEREAFWDHTALTERLFERQIAPALPELTADIYLQRAVVYVLERSWTAAAGAAWKSWTLLRKGVARDPLTAQLRGLWQVVFASLPPPYDRFLPGQPRGHYEEARRLLRQAAEPQAYTTIEASLLYLSVLKNFDTMALAWADTCRMQLFAEKPPPYLWQFALALLAWESGKVSQAETLLLELTRRPQIQRFPYPLYWLGKLYAFRGEEEQAEKAWQQFVIFQTEPHGMAAQYGWRGLGAWRRGDTALARQYWEQCLTYVPLWDEDSWLQRQARQWLKTPPSSTDIILWGARQAIEVAQYTRARYLLESLREILLQLKSDEKVQFYYLYGRLYEKTGNIEGAKFAYYQATRQVTAQNAWVRAYAAYYLARLYEREGDWHNARLYYADAQAIAREIERLSILQKARAGYWRIQDKRYPVPPEKPMKTH